MHGLWEYLEASGALATGDADTISKAKQEYWKAYRRAWNKEQRIHYTVAYSHKENEELLRAARKFNRKATTYIRQSSLAYAKNIFLIPDVATVQDIRALLAKTYLLIQRIAEAENDAVSRYAAILDCVESLEKEVLRQLTTPDNIIKIK